MIEKIAFNQYIPLNSYYPGTIYENPNNPKPAYDPQKALQLLAEAGWKEWAAIEDPDDVYHAPPLPKWTAPKHVKRELLGRFLEDRDAHLIHDAQAATEACNLDGIRNGTWYHFWSEVPDDAGEPHPACIPA